MSSRISFSATNPCHLYPMALQLLHKQALSTYWSGYPAWKLQSPPNFPLRSHSFRTCVVYGMRRLLPPHLRPADHRLFQWQDRAFDHWVARNLEPSDFFHAIPGQCLESFRAAKKMGIRTVLNHATGPTQQLHARMKKEYERAGLKFEKYSPYDQAYFERESETYALADFHCVASHLVADQLKEQSVPAEKIWIVPYGADPSMFSPPVSNSRADDTFRIIFAGQITLRKGIRFLLEAWRTAKLKNAELHFYGEIAPEMKPALDALPPDPRVYFHGSVSTPVLANAFRQGSVLALPSLEEGFGLVVVQALACGLPCIVSDAVGAKDLIFHHENGSVFPSQDAQKLAEELLWWNQNPRLVHGDYSWEKPSECLIHLSQKNLS